MAISISTKPNEKGTAVITISFTDEDSAVVTPTNLQWQLIRTSTGEIVNNRSFVNGSFTAVGGSATIVLSCDDLAVFKGWDDLKRTLGVQGIYDSSAGSDLCIKEEATFSINALNTQDNS